jgi:hypothetical protein
MLHPVLFSPRSVTCSDIFRSFYILFADCIKWRNNGQTIVGLPASYISEIFNPNSITEQVIIAVTFVRELLGSNTGYSRWDFFMVYLSPSGQLSRRYLDHATTASFQILFNSLFTNRLTIRCSIVSTLTASWNKNKDSSGGGGVYLRILVSEFHFCSYRWSTEYGHTWHKTQSKLMHFIRNCSSYTKCT